MSWMSICPSGFPLGATPPTLSRASVISRRLMIICLVIDRLLRPETIPPTNDRGSDGFLRVPRST